MLTKLLHVKTRFFFVNSNYYFSLLKRFALWYRKIWLLIAPFQPPSWKDQGSISKYLCISLIEEYWSLSGSLAHFGSIIGMSYYDSPSLGHISLLMPTERHLSLIRSKPRPQISLSTPERYIESQLPIQSYLFSLILFIYEVQVKKKQHGSSHENVPNSIFVKRERETWSDWKGKIERSSGRFTPLFRFLKDSLSLYQRTGI